MGRKKLKKSTRKFLKNTRLRRGVKKAKKKHQRIRRSKDIKRDRLLREKLRDDENEEKRSIERHLEISGSKQRVDAKISEKKVENPYDQFRLLEYLGRIHHPDNVQFSKSEKSNISSFSPNSQDKLGHLKCEIWNCTKVLESFPSEGVLPKLKEILPTLSRSLSKAFERTSVTENLVVNDSSTFRGLKPQLLALYKSLVRCMMKILEEESKSESQYFFDNELYSCIDRLLPFLGRFLDISQVFLNLLLSSIFQSFSKSTKKQLNKNTLNVLYRLCCFHPFPLIQTCLRMTVSIFCAKRSNFNAVESDRDDTVVNQNRIILLDFLAHTFGINFDVSSTIVYELLYGLNPTHKNTMGSNTNTRSNGLHLHHFDTLSMLEVVLRVVEEYSVEFNLLVHPVMEIAMDFLRRKVSVKFCGENRRQVENVMRRMSGICKRSKLYVPIIRSFCGIFSKVFLSSMAMAGQKQQRKGEEEAAASRSLFVFMENVLLVLMQTLTDNSNNVAFPELSFHVINVFQTCIAHSTQEGEEEEDKEEHKRSNEERQIVAVMRGMERAIMKNAGVVNSQRKDVDFNPLMMGASSSSGGRQGQGGGLRLEEVFLRKGMKRNVETMGMKREMEKMVKKRKFGNEAKKRKRTKRKRNGPMKEEKKRKKKKRKMKR